MLEVDPTRRVLQVAKPWPLSDTEDGKTTQKVHHPQQFMVKKVDMYRFDTVDVFFSLVVG